MTTGRYLVRPESFADLEQEWWELLESCRSDTIFLTPAWQKPWAEGALDGGGYRPIAVRLDGRLVGLAPLRRNGNQISFAADPNLCDYLDILSVQGQEEAVYEAVLGHLIEEPWMVLDLTGVPASSPTLEALPTWARAQGYQVDVETWDVSPRAELPGTWEEFLSGLRKKDRHELRRKIRRLDKAGELSYILVESDNDGLPAALDRFLHLMRTSREDKARFLTEKREGFFVDLARSMARRGYLRLFLLELDRQIVSAVMAFTYGGDFLLYNSGYDTDYSSLSVGLILKAHCIDYSIRQGLRSFDFLRGNEAYKYHLGGVDRNISRVLIRRDRVR